MVAPSPTWNDYENGYRKADDAIFVEPVYIQSGEGVQTTQTVDRASANAYSVEVIQEIDHAPQQHETIITFAEERDAWEFANLLTRYAEYLHGDVQGALMNFNDAYEENWNPPAIVEDLSAEEAMKKLAGHYAFHIEELLDE